MPGISLSHRGVGGGVNLLEIDKPTIWLDAAAGVTHAANAVSSWVDKSNGYDFTQGSAGAKPTYTLNAINGRPALDFDGGDYLQHVGAIVSGERGTAFMVVKSDAPTSSDAIWSAGDKDANQEYVMFLYGGSNFQILQDSADVDDVNESTSATDGNTTIWVAGSYGDSYFIRKDGADEVVVTSGGSDNGDWFADCVGVDSVTVGRRNNAGGSYNWDGLIGEIIYYDGAVLSARAIDLIEAYLSDKWGVSLP